MTLADASRMATLCEPSQAPKYGLKYGPAHTKKDKPATGAGLRGICGGETVRRNPFRVIPNSAGKTLYIADRYN